MAASAAAPVETMIVMEAFGRALALEPYLATVVLGGGLLRRGGSDAQQQARSLPQIAAGELLLAFAHAERQSRYDLADVATTAQTDGGGWVLDGAKGVVLHGDSADKLIVTRAHRRRPARPRRHRRCSWSMRSAPGVSRRGYPTQDGLRAAEITLAGVRVGRRRVLGEPGKRAAADRARGRRGDRRALRRGGRRDGGDARRSPSTT